MDASYYLRLAASPNYSEEPAENLQNAKESHLAAQNSNDPVAHEQATAILADIQAKQDAADAATIGLIVGAIAILAALPKADNSELSAKARNDRYWARKTQCEDNKFYGAMAGDSNSLSNYVHCMNMALTRN